AEAKRRFGAKPSLAIQLQLGAARERLDALAKWQAARVGQGWIIEHTEWKPPRGSVPLRIAGKVATLPIKSKIDRIQRKPSTGQVATLDYRTGEPVPKPMSAHRKRTGAWIDLQLPLYRHLAAGLDIGKAPILGYIAIPKLVRDCGMLRAEWNEQELASADA